MDTILPSSSVKLKTGWLAAYKYAATLHSFVPEKHRPGSWRIKPAVLRLTVPTSIDYLKHPAHGTSEPNEDAKAIPRDSTMLRVTHARVSRFASYFARLWPGDFFGHSVEAEITFNPRASIQGATRIL
ncbi:hypothetical protein [Burkholderia sp. Bp8998]|uniref:hypothetical protein n=1 Tax=Burkholderia sp. Bp8998 TaxID=2184557 RepID=UPI000F59A2DF|nr:hypothetical protein [Burkholderia sp. Bp8998]